MDTVVLEKTIDGHQMYMQIDCLEDKLNAHIVCETCSTMHHAEGRSEEYDDTFVNLLDTTAQMHADGIEIDWHQLPESMLTKD